MKEIYLPISQTISIPLKPDLSKAIDLGNGKFRVPLGQVSSEEVAPFVDTARKNGGSILYATTSIEQQLEAILMRYFMTPPSRYEERHRLFEQEILQSTALSFHAKKELVSKILNHEEILDGKKKNNLQKLLKSIMEWRNAFAHGKLIYNVKSGCVLEYYSGKKMKLNLTDEYWDGVEKSFHDCVALLTEMLNKLSRKTEHE